MHILSYNCTIFIFVYSLFQALIYFEEDFFQWPWAREFYVKEFCSVSFSFSCISSLLPSLLLLSFFCYKSPRVPGLSFPSYRDSTFLSIFAVPNNAVFWITSNLTFTPIRFMYSLKLTCSSCTP